MQIKNSDFFKKYIENWSDVEKGKLQSEMRLEMKDPANSYEFDEICYDSDDADFQHEYEDLDLEVLESSKYVENN